ncbi:MAG: sodium:proton exchanger [Pseudomonadota bacterium]
MKRFLLLVAIAVLAAAPAALLALSGRRFDPIVDAAIFGTGILAAGFLLSWGAEAAERHIAQGLVLAGVALITVLPEYAVDFYYAFQAGHAGPGSAYVHYAAANMTGANRLLVGLAWPLLVFLHWLKNRNRAIELGDGNAIEISFLLVASLYAFVVLFKAQIGLPDFAVLAAIYAAYIWRVRHIRKAEDADDEGEPGPAAALDALPVRQQWAMMAALAAVACAVILLSAEHFAEAMVDSGRSLGINEFLLIQWLAPLASEAPAVSVAILFVLAGRAAGGLTTMISDKINQWTLLVGMLPVAMSIGAGAATALPLDARQGEEFFLTGAQSLLGVALLLRLRLGLPSACLLLVMFAAQVGLAYHYRDNEAATISTLTALAWVYLAFAFVVLLPNARRLLVMLRFAFSVPAARR